MKTPTQYSLNQLATVLSALDGERRNPNTKHSAIAAIGRSAEPLGLTAEEVLAAAAGLLDGRMSAEEFREALAADGSDDEAAEAETAADADAPAQAPKTRKGTKQALMIDMLRRPEGATIAQIAEVTGWAHHTIRGSIADALKKKLGLAVTSEKVDGGARTYRIAG